MNNETSKMSRLESSLNELEQKLFTLRKDFLKETLAEVKKLFFTVKEEIESLSLGERGKYITQIDSFNAYLVKADNEFSKYNPKSPKKPGTFELWTTTISGYLITVDYFHDYAREAFRRNLKSTVDNMRSNAFEILKISKPKAKATGAAPQSFFGQFFGASSNQMANEPTENNEKNLFIDEPQKINFLELLDKTDQKLMHLSDDKSSEIKEEFLKLYDELELAVQALPFTSRSTLFNRVRALEAQIDKLLFYYRRAFDRKKIKPSVKAKERYTITYDRKQIKRENYFFDHDEKLFSEDVNKVIQILRKDILDLYNFLT